MKHAVKVLLCAAAVTAVAFTPKPVDKPKGPKYIDKANMDPGVKPGDNFYLYVNGGWLKRNPVPGSKTRWGSFDLLREESSKRMQALLLDAVKKSGTDARMQKIGDFYTSGMDSVTTDNLGYTPVKADLQRIDAITDINGLLNEIAYNRTQGISSALFGFSLGQDRKKVTEYIPQLAQGGTTLPDRDYYFKKDARSTTVRNAYAQHLKNMFALIGEDAATAQTHANAVLRIETALAKAQNSRTEMRDPYKTYNKFAVKDLNTTTPAIDWTVMLNKLQLTGADSVIVNNPAFFKSVDILLTALPLEDWKTYVKWNLLNDVAPYLSSPFVK
jgi:putative endopeptidase